MVEPPANIACVVLAAGASVRFGKAKLLEPLENGVAMIRATVDVYLSVLPSVSVVCQPDNHAMKAVLSELPVTLIENPNWDQGLSQSLIAGIVANRDADGWLIALGDMPYVQAETIHALIERFHPDSIIQPHSGQRGGNPVLFGANFYRELITIRGDNGGKTLVSKHNDRVVEYHTQDFGILHDIDRPSDLISPRGRS